MKRILPLLLVLLMVFTALPISAFAESDDVLFFEDSEAETIVIEEIELPMPDEDGDSGDELIDTKTEPSKVLGSSEDVLQTFMLMTLSERIENPYITYTYSPRIVNTASPIIFTDESSGMPAYCIDYNRAIPSSNSLGDELDPETIFDPATFEGLKCLLLAGYPYTIGDGLTAAEAQGCTQLAVWCWTYEAMGYGLNAANYTAISGKEYIYDYFHGLLEAARNQTQPDLRLYASDVSLVLDGDVLTGQTTVSINNLDGGYSLDESRLPEGVTVFGFTGSDGDVLTFTAPISYAGQRIVLEDILSGHDSRSTLNLFWYDNTNSNQQRMEISVMDQTAVAISADISMSFQSVGTIKLIKLSENDNTPLPGAVFGLYVAETDEKICELITDSNGEATYLLAYGDYYLLEEVAPAGFRLDGQKYPVGLDDTEIRITVTNTKKGGKLELYKMDEVGTGLANAVFGVYRASDDEKICEITSDDTGYAEVSLLVDDYYLLELTAPEGFQKSDEKIPFNITDDEEVEMTVINTRIPDEAEPNPGKLIVIKTSDAGTRLAAAVFGIYRVSDDEKLGEIATDENGEVEYELPEGDYYLIELTAPNGYRLLTSNINFSIVSGESITLNMANSPVTTDTTETYGYLKIIKKSEDGKTLLKGAVFGIYRVSDDVKVSELTTDKYGEATCELPEGDYYCKELTAPDGYQLVSGKTSFSITADSTKTLTITNPPLPDDTGTLKLTKKAEDTGELLSDAVFGIYKESTDVKIAEITTNSKGIATIELEPGDYYLKELSAPTGYSLSTEKTGCTIKADETVKLTITNKPITSATETNTEKTPSTTGILRLIKSAEGTGKRLSGAVFGVYSVSGNTKLAELTTNSNGEATLDLPLGDYYLKEQTAPSGYQLETAKISFTILKIDTTVKVEVTNLLTTTITDSGTPTGTITVPKTGETPPYGNYILAVLILVIAGLCGAGLYHGGRRHIA